MAKDPTRGTALRIVARFGGALAASFVLLVVLGAAVAAAADVGHKDFADSGGSAVTGSKPESKLWYNDGFWWGALQPTTTGGLFIFKLDPGTDSWVSTGVQIDSRSSNHLRADTLWDGSKLYAATQIQNEGGNTGTGASFEARLYRFSYNASTDTYTKDTGFPAVIRSGLQSETLVIDKDSTNTLWATWTQPSGSDRLVYTNHTLNGNDTTWSTPAFLPVGSQGVGVTTDADDISTIIAFTVSGQHRIGVFWSNQADKRDYFAWHVDGAADSAWTAETALSGSGSQADDHVNIKTDASGQLYVVVKTSLTGSNPLIKLLRRTTGGTWNDFVVGIDNVASNTRPILELEESGSGNILHVFMTGKRSGSTTGQSGGDIFEKSSPVSSISFPAGLGTQVIHDGSSTGDCSVSSTNPTGCLNNVTSTKQNVNSTTGVVVAAFDDKADRYWHSTQVLTGGGAPVADFSGTPTSGPPGQTVQFSDLSTNSPNQWSWNFGDPASGGSNTSTQQNPSHTYAAAGQYTVSLTATNGSGSSNPATKTNYITITSGGGGSTITLDPVADAQVYSSSTSKNYGTLSTIRAKGGTSSIYQSFLRFNVTGLSGSVTGVKLRLFVTDASPNTQSVYPVADTSWGETAITWNNAPAMGGTALGAATAPTASSYVEINLSTAAVTGNGLVSFGLQSNGTNSAIFSSREGANHPQLVITQSSSGPPTAAFTASPTTTTPNTSIQFTDQSTGGPTTWDWNFGDGTAHASTANPTHAYTAPGLYDVTLTVTNGSGPGTLTKSGYINVGNPPTADFTATPNSGSAPLDVTFADASTGGPTSWAWDFDNNGTVDSTVQNPGVHQYATGGTFTAKLTASNVYGSSSTTKQITVTGPPTADFSGTPLFLNPNQSVAFTDLTTGQGPFTYAWDFGDSGTSPAQNPTHPYTAVGAYTVALTVTNGAGPNTATKNAYIHVGDAPTAAFAANPDSGNAPLTVNFSNTSSGTGPLSYAWDFDNNGSVDDTTASPSHVFAAGSYTVKLTVSSSYGTDSVTHPVTATGGGGGTITLNPVADAIVTDSSVNKNDGVGALIRTREGAGPTGDYRSYLRFDVSGFSGTVQSIKLRLFVDPTGSSPDQQGVYAVSNTSWIETGTGGITWANAPATGSLLGQAVASPTGSYVEITLSNSAVSGNGLVSFALKGINGTSTAKSAYFNSREAASNPPQLVIVTQ